MRPIAVIPASALSSVERLLAAAGWQGKRVPKGWADDAGAAVALADSGRTVLFVPPGAPVPRHVRRIVVVHGGSRAERAGVDAADEAAVATRAEVVVLFVPSASPPIAAASLAFTMGDHPEHDWAEWREEFMNRFCRCAEGVALSLRVATGGTARSVPFTSRQVRADLVIVTRDGGSDPSRAATLVAILAACPCPVLVVPAAGKAREIRERVRTG